MIPETERADFKSAEQQVRETLGWWIEDGNVSRVNGARLAAYSTESNAYIALVSKTAELMEMTAQRDEAQKALDEAQVAATGARDFKFSLATAEATIREQAERIRELEGALEEIREDVLHERGSMAEMDFGNDRVNAVLGIIDDHTPRGKQ